MNGVKLLVESGWVVDENYFKHLCEVSGIDKIVEGYFSAKKAKTKIDAKVVSILRFANKFAENLGMTNFFGLDRLIAMNREPNEVYFNLDPGLYFSQKQVDANEQSKKNKERLARADLIDTASENDILV